MIPLETNQIILMWLYAFPSDKAANKWKKCAYFVCASSFIITHSSSLIAGGLFAYKFISVDLELVLFALFHTIGSFNMVYQSGATVALRHKLSAIFKTLTKIYNKSKRKILVLSSSAILVAGFIFS